MNFAGVLLRVNRYTDWPGYWIGREIITPDPKRLVEEAELIAVRPGGASAVRVLVRLEGPLSKPGAGGPCSTRTEEK